MSDKAMAKAGLVPKEAMGTSKISAGRHDRDRRRWVWAPRFDQDNGVSDAA
jgi:hypothetical protein